MKMKRHEESVPSNYNFDQFCTDLDPDSVYVERILELLVRETVRNPRREPVPTQYPDLTVTISN